MGRAPQRAAKTITASRSTLIETVQKPLGFFVLVVLVIETIMGGLAGFSSSDRPTIVWIMAGIIVLLIAAVTGLALFRPETVMSSPTAFPVAPSQAPALAANNTTKYQFEVHDNLAKLPIRCSFSGLIRIEVHGRYLLIRGGRIMHQYQPVGGVYKRLPPSLSELQGLRVQDDDKMPVDEQSREDLRVRVPGQNIQKFFDWFQSRRGREIEPWREFYEELLETGILDRAIFPYISCSLYKTHITGIQWSDFMKCHELLVSEIFVLHPNDLQTSHLISTQKIATDAFQWVTRDEILNRGLKSGLVTIAPTAEWLF